MDDGKSRPPGLTTGDSLCCREVFEVLVVRDDVDRVVQGLQGRSPTLEGLEYSQEFLVVSVVIESCTIQGACTQC